MDATANRFLDSLEIVGKYPLALVGYAVIAAAWVLRAWLATRPQRQAKEILSQYQNDSDRLAALRELTGTQPPTTLRRADTLEWLKIRAKNQGRIMLLAAYLATLLVTIAIVSVAFQRADDPDPVIIDTKVHR